ncbi:MAG TPA: DNA repair protein RecN [Dehalococcoidales bacterium]|nr:DNA repair protein RecN [Dehalococcoidales bacterium]
MLVELRVKNLGIIEDMNWRLDEGLNIITGETGAGKSLVIDAVELLLAGKADEEVIRHGADQAQIEGVFSLPPQENLASLRELLAEKELAADEDTLVIDCQLRRKSPDIIRVNGHAVPKAFLRQIGRLLVDIHGQSDHLSLFDSGSHLDFLDAYAHTTELCRDFTARAKELNRVEQELKALEKDEQERARREEFLRFQLEEISRAQLKEGEETELERERDILGSAEKLKTISYEAYRALYEEDASGRATPALDKLNEAAQAIKKLVEIDPSLKPQLDSLEATIDGLTDTARGIRAYSDGLEYDPNRLEEIETRLEIIRGLKRKYGQSISEVLAYLAKAQKELDEVSNSAERSARLKETAASLKQTMGQTAAQLSTERAQAAEKLTTEVEKELNDLNMPQVEFRVALSREKDEDGIPLPDGLYAFTNEGVDTVEFMASTNPGEPLKPLAKIASTGELSRFTLALKGALSEADHIPVLIFDEIDIGIGGRSGEIIGKKLSSLARNHQVVCVTHLPQIAVFADAHFSVHKELAGERTLSLLESLEDEARLKELAIMLAGAHYTETALTNARELMHKAETWKKPRPD